MLELNHISNAIGYKVNKANSILRKYFNKIIQDSGNNITPEQWGLINFLLYNPGVKQAEIVKITNRDQTSITRMLDGLQKKRLIQRKIDKQDRRIYKIYATEEAQIIYDSILPYAKIYNDTLKTVFSEKECKIFIENLDRVISRIDKLLLNDVI
jgi:MarR family transcriptional regulator, transcriptional regulator for hemolysin